jgi:hypothetical protein
MNELSTAIDTANHESTSTLAKAAKIAGGAILTGLAAYGLARGVELLVPVDPTELYETVVAGTGMVVGGALTALATEK